MHIHTCAQLVNTPSRDIPRRHPLLGGVVGLLVGVVGLIPIAILAAGSTVRPSSGGTVDACEGVDCVAFRIVHIVIVDVIRQKTRRGIAPFGKILFLCATMVRITSLSGEYASLTS